MRLISLNIGIKLDNAASVVEFLQEHDADIIALQEVASHTNPAVTSQYKSRLSLERALNTTYTHIFFAPLWSSDGFRFRDLPTKPDRLFGGIVEQGCMILSKSAIAHGTNEFFYRNYEYIADWSDWYTNDHGRAVQLAHIDTPAGRLQVLNLHGIWTRDKQGDERTIKECEFIVKAALRYPELPTLIVGDFNLLPDSPSIAVISKHFRNLIDEFTIASTRPDIVDETDRGQEVVDYIFVNNKVKVTNFQVIPTGISDHLPLQLDFEILP